MASAKILVIDDEEKLRSLMKRIISLEGFTVSEAGNLKQAEKLIEKEQPEVLLCDVKLPDGNGVDFVSKIKAKYPVIEIILLTAFATVQDGVQAIKNGAFDYIVKGDDNDKIIPLLNRAIEKVQLQKRLQQLQKQVGRQYSFDNILGTSAEIKEAIQLAKKVAATDTTVLLLGETGTGKEVFAQAIHAGSKRNGQPFLAVNCSSFSKELLESEIFGHKAGAFTGATKDKKGLIEEADQGTLFLDEIGEMPADLQAKLLRVLETNEFIKVGDSKPSRVNVRIIAATNRDLKQDVENGKFRDDLFYRLNVFSISLPPLRERKKDIPELAYYFLQIFSDKTNKRINSIQTDVMNRLQAYNWKGNIRELKNTIERAVILEDGDQLTISALPFELQHIESDSGDISSAFHLSTIEKQHIQKVLHHTKGNKTKTAELLGIGLTTLYRKMEEYHISG
ncbi:MAG TPA: sigma-54 dependent transcriptional regulator [Chitinophagaceae bacterium]|nr:sigma-54 dependent transcriptional regulator [Chitinophagaceae bacterium]